MTVFVKLAGQDISTIQIVFVRGLFTLVVTYAIILFHKVPPLGQNKNVLMVRGITGTVALFLVYESISISFIAVGIVVFNGCVFNC